MDKTDIQKIVNEVCDKYKVKRIPIRVTVRKYKGVGLAYYATYKVKAGGKIQKQHHPRFIMICDWDEIERSGRFPILQVAHELAHHVMNVRKNSLGHTGEHGNLEDTIGIYISKKLRGKG